MNLFRNLNSDKKNIRLHIQLTNYEYIHIIILYYKSYYLIEARE